jgi:Mycolic acid cyclopropane synthetase
MWRLLGAPPPKDGNRSNQVCATPAHRSVSALDPFRDGSDGHLTRRHANRLTPRRTMAIQCGYPAPTRHSSCWGQQATRPGMTDAPRAVPVGRTSGATRQTLTRIRIWAVRCRAVHGAVSSCVIAQPFVYVYINCAMNGSPEETIARFGLGDEGLAAWRAALLPEDRFADWLTDRVARRPTGARARAVYGADDVHDFARRAILGALDLQPEDRLLDIGCGGGLLLRDAALAGAVVTGLDHAGARARRPARGLHDPGSAARYARRTGADRQPRPFPHRRRACRLRRCRRARRPSSPRR